MGHLLTKDIETYDTTIRTKNIEDKLDVYRAENNTLKSDMDKLLLLHDKTLHELEALQQSHASILEQNVQLSQADISRSQQVELLECTLRNLQSDYDAMSLRSSELDSSCTERTDEVSQLQLSSTLQQEELVALTTTLHNIQTELETTRRVSAKHRELETHRTQELQDQISGLLQDKDSISSSLHQTTRELEKCEHLYKQTSATCKAYETVLQTYSDKVELYSAKQQRCIDILSSPEQQSALLRPALETIDDLALADYVQKCMMLVFRNLEILLLDTLGTDHVAEPRSIQ